MTTDATFRGRSRLLAAVASTCLVVSVVMLVYGAAVEGGKLAQRVVTLGGLARAVIVCAAYWIAVLLAVRFAGRRRLPLAIGLVLLVVSMSAEFAATAAALLLFASAWSLGDLVLRRVTSLGNDATGFVVRTASGLAIVGSVLSLLALFPVNTPATYVLLLIAPIGLDVRSLGRLIGGWLATGHDEITTPALLGLGVLGNVALVALLVALLPEVGNDALSHHMALLAHLRDFGRWHFDVERTLYAVMPLAGDFLYAAPFMLAGEFGARLANLGCFFLLLVLVYGWTRAASVPGITLLCVLCAAAIPLAFLETSSLFIENPWALFLVTSVALVARLHESEAAATGIYPAALLCGAAVATKVMAVAAVPAIVIAAALAVGRNHPRHFWLAMALGLAVAMPPYVIALVETGNPVFPFMNSVFRSPHFYSTDIETSWHGTLDPLFLYRATFDSPAYLETTHAGAIGFVPLLAFPMAVFVSLIAGPRRARVVAVTAVSFVVIVIATTAYLRYIYPAFFLLTLALGSVLAELHAYTRRTFDAARVVLAFGVAASLPLVTSLLVGVKDFPVEAVFSEHARSEFIKEVAPHRAIVDRINLEPLESGNAAFLGRPYVAGLQRPVYMRSLLTPIFSTALLSDFSPANVAKALASRGVAFAVVDSTTPAPLVETIGKLGTLMMEHGTARLYRIDDRGGHTAEVSRPLPAAPPDWSLLGNPAVSAEGDVTVTSTDYVGSRAPVSGGVRYRVDTLARCDAPGEHLRVQISWMDENDGLIEVSYVDKPCRRDWHTESASFVAPRGADHAAVYVLGADTSRVVLRRVALERE